MKQNTLQNQSLDKESNLKQVLEGLLVFDNVQLALIRGVITGMKMEQKIKDDKNKVS